MRISLGFQGFYTISGILTDQTKSRCTNQDVVDPTELRVTCNDSIGYAQLC